MVLNPQSTVHSLRSSVRQWLMAKGEWHFPRGSAPGLFILILIFIDLAGTLPAFLHPIVRFSMLKFAFSEFDSL
jgi:hypothetical protein